MAKRASGLPAPLARGALRFEKWRETRTTHRIPENLWSLASALGSQFGVSRTSRALRVQYRDLRKRVEEGAPEGCEIERSPTFVELLAGPQSSLPELLVELESADGEKMRVQTRGVPSRDLAELCRVFLERGR